MNKNQLISAIGLGITVGSLVKVLPFHTLILFSIGLGLLVGGISQELRKLDKKFSSQKEEDVQ